MTYNVFAGTLNLNQSILQTYSKSKYVENGAYLWLKWKHRMTGKVFISITWYWACWWVYQYISDVASDPDLPSLRTSPAFGRWCHWHTYLLNKVTGKIKTTAHLKYCHREWMLEVAVRCKDHLTIMSAEVWSEDDMELGIDPEEAIAIVICNAKIC